MSPSSVRDASSTNLAPDSSCTLPSANLPTRILGPCRSAMMATSRPARWAAARTVAARSIWSCALPWLKFSRTTFTPARIMASSSAGSLEAGPRVATILVARRVGMGLSLSLVCLVDVIEFQFSHEAVTGELPLASALRSKSPIRATGMTTDAPAHAPGSPPPTHGARRASLPLPALQHAPAQPQQQGHHAPAHQQFFGDAAIQQLDQEGHGTGGV